MNHEDYKKSLEKLQISTDFTERTAKIMKDTFNNKKNPNTAKKKLVITFASTAIVITAGIIALNYNHSLFPSKNQAIENYDNTSVLMATTDAEGITVPVTQLPTDDNSGKQADMIGLFVYKGRVYLQSNTSFAVNENYMINKDDVTNLKGEYLGKTKGSITEWSKQEDYATEFASTIGESDIYTVKGYDSKYRLMVYSEYEGVFNCEIYDSFGGQLLENGADYFNILNLKNNMISYQWESYDSWNNGKGIRTDADIDNTFKEFIDELYTAIPKGQMMEMFDNMDYDSQKFIYVRTKDNLITTLRLFKDGYVYAPEVGFFQMNQDVFDAFWNTLPVDTTEEVTETPSNNISDDNISLTNSIDVTLSSLSYPVGTDSITLNIKNNSNEEIYYGVDYSIEKLNGDTWEVVPAVADLMFIEIAKILSADSEDGFKIDLSQLNPRLDVGVYRIVKNINGEQYYIKFELTK